MARPPAICGWTAPLRTVACIVAPLLGGAVALARLPPGAARAATAPATASATAAVSAPGRLAPVAPAPGWACRGWSTRDGLPVNSVNDVLQTRDGFLWLATFDGLVRFDGVAFERFDLASTRALTSNRILALRETGPGTLWALTQNGVVSWFERAAEGRLALPSLGDTGRVNALYVDRAGALWLGATDGVWRVQGKRAEPFARAALAGPVQVLCVDRGGALWAAGPWGAARVAAGGSAPQAVTRYAPPAADESAVNSFYELADGRMVLGTQEGLYAPVDPRTGAPGRLVAIAPRELAARVERVVAVHGLLADTTLTPALAEFYAGVQRNPEPTYLRGLKPCTLDRDGVSWSADGARLLRAGRPVFSFPAEITRVTSDHDGHVWIGTGGAGFFRVKRARVAAVADSIGGEPNAVYSLAIGPDGTLWMAGFRRGLGWWRDGRVGGFRGPPLAVTVEATPDGHVYLGSYMAGLYEVRGAGLAPVAPEVIGRDRIVSLVHQDRTGDLWVGTDAGIFRRSHGAWTHYDESSGLPSRRVRTCLERRDGSLWFGTNGGGVAIFRGGRFETLGEAQGLPTNLVRGMHEDERGVVWLATEGRGLVRVDLAPGAPVTRAVVRTYGRSDGLFDDTLHAIVEDAAHDLWISTNRGLFRVGLADLDRYRPGRGEALRCRVIDDTNGMPDREANGGVQGAALVAPDGRVWFATQAGAVVLDPRQIRPTAPPPPVAIESAVSENTKLSLLHESVRLRPEQRDLAVRFAALTFMNPHNLRFRYRLVGYDKDWIEVGEQREAFFSRLPPGRYRLEVTARASNGPWNPHPATLDIEAVPRFWETWWFRALVALAVVSAGIALYRARMRATAQRERALAQEVAQRTATIENQAARLRELNDTRTRFFADVSHEFRTPLTLTIGPLEDLMAGMHGPLAPDVAEQLELALRNSRRALRQVNRLLDLAKLEAGAMRIAAGPGDAVARVKDLVETFRPQAERKHIAVTTRWPEQPPLVHFDPQLFEQAVANLLSNAVKFTPEGGRIDVEARVEAQPGEAGAPGWLAIAVRDTGPGIPEAERRDVFERFHQLAGARSRLTPGTGIGLSLAREIVELHGGRIDLASEVGQGSTFTIRMRLGSAHLGGEKLARPGEQAEPGTLPSWLLADPTPRAPADGAAERPAAPGDEELAPGDETQTVLLVEDDGDVRLYVRRLLSPLYRVIEASDGASGLALARREPPDCIVSDVMMAGMDGFELCRAVREDPEIDSLPVILLTARAAADSQLEGLSCGADAYLSKPFRAPELLVRIKNAIDVRRRLRDRLRPRELHARPVAVTAADDVFLSRVREAIEERLSDEGFTVGGLADALGYERSRLYRRLKEAAGCTPEALIKQFRLERAAQLLDARAGTVSEVAYAVGFKSVTHFCKVFRDKYGLTPGSFSARKQTA